VIFGEMTLIEMQNDRPPSWRNPNRAVRTHRRSLYTYYKTDISVCDGDADINRELCRRLRRADNRIAGLADAHASE